MVFIKFGGISLVRFSWFLRVVFEGVCFFSWFFFCDWGRLGFWLFEVWFGEKRRGIKERGRVFERRIE